MNAKYVIRVPYILSYCWTSPVAHLGGTGSIEVRFSQPPRGLDDLEWVIGILRQRHPDIPTDASFVWTSINRLERSRAWPRSYKRRSGLGLSAAKLAKRFSPASAQKK